MQNHVFTIAETCKKAGITHVVICPGSRSAPLVQAFAGDALFQCFSIIDERSAGYMALGMARQLARPVVLICTSGTASLNFFPAIAEAFYQKTPLLVLTADRPPELLNQQDGQMIMQNNVFGRHVLLSLETPHSGTTTRMAKETSDIMHQAIRVCMAKPSGPVHINIPLREPLYGYIKTKPNTVRKAISVADIQETPAHPTKQLASLVDAWQKAKRKLILIGQYPSDNALFTQLLNLSEHGDVVILSDVLSNQQRMNTAPCFDFMISHAEGSVAHNLKPDLILSFGGPVLSKSLKIWLKSFKPQHHFRIDAGNEKVNTYQNVTHSINAVPVEVLSTISGWKTNAVTTWKKLWQQLNTLAETRIDSFVQQSGMNELSATAAIMNQLPDACDFHIGNSSVIRYVSYSGKLKPSVLANGNRGTSGIDGCTSTAVGAAMVNNRLTVLLTGDLSFFYDRNALWLNKVPSNLKIIVINNQGGGIFTLIDGPPDNKKLLPYFTTPISQKIVYTALQSQLEYYFCDSLPQLENTLKSFFEPGEKAAILEIKCDMNQNAKAFQLFKKLKLI